MTSSSIRIRPATSGDAPSVERVHRDSLHRRGCLTRGLLVIPVADMVKALATAIRRA